MLVIYQDYEGNLPFYLRRGHQRRAPQVNKSFFFFSSFSSNYQILPYNDYFRLHQWYLMTSREMWLPGKVWLPGKFDFPGNVSSREMWLQKIWFPGKCDFREIWLHGKYEFLLNATSRESWFSGKYDFLGNVTSWEMWLPGKYYFPGNETSQEMWISRKYDFPLHTWAACVETHKTSSQLILKNQTVFA